MSQLIALQLVALTVTDRVRCRARRRLAVMRGPQPEDGLSTLEITIIALGLFLLAGAAVLALTTATNTRLNQIQ